jgi:GNAT superfamily N-acetyltransferase
MDIRTLSRDELERFHELDRTETIERIYYYRDGALVLEDEHWDVPDWSPEQKDRIVADLQAIYDRGATGYGAFAGGRLVGLAVLAHAPLPTGVERLNLAGLWVSHGYRARGIGRTLVHRAIKEARGRGARTLYVSATPSENTVHFYQRLGFRLTDLVDPGLYEEEPDDIHMELPL